MGLPSVHINDIPEEGGLSLDVPLDASWMATILTGTDFEPQGEPAGRVNLQLERHGRDVTLSGTVEARLRSECVRCLSPVPISVCAEFTLNLEPAQGSSLHGRRGEIELSEENLDADVYENDRVDVSQWVREQILLEAPAHPQCPQGCTEPIGVPTQPPSGGSNATEAVDPRLAPLKQFTQRKRK